MSPKCGSWRSVVKCGSERSLARMAKIVDTDGDNGFHYQVRWQGSYGHLGCVRAGLALL